MNATMHNFKRIIKMLGLQVMLSTFLLLLMQGVTESSSAQAQPQYRELAAHWAPIVSQDIDDANTRAEYITRFNYDGDWRSNNNWNHLNRYELPAYIYYWVTETETHYFVGYAFFHPRDWESHTLGDIGEHENDMEGILLTIKKEPTQRYGQFVSLLTVAHLDFYSYTDRDTPSSSPWYALVAPSRNVTNGHEDIDGDVDFVGDNVGLHPVVYIQSEGHGVYGKEHHVTDYVPVFRSNPTDWRGLSWLGIPNFPRESASGWSDGIVYHYEGIADVPTRAGNPKHWQIVGYDLLSIKDLWDRREDYRGTTGSTRITFEKFGTFDGDNGNHDAANAPWGWDDHNDGESYRGEFFQDPAHLVDHYFNGLGTFLHRYVGYSYVSPTVTVVGSPTNESSAITATVTYHSYDAATGWVTFRIVNNTGGATLECVEGHIINRSTGANYYGPNYSDVPFRASPTQGYAGYSSMTAGQTRYLRFKLIGNPTGVPCRAVLTLYTGEGKTGSSSTKTVDFDI